MDLAAARIDNDDDDDNERKTKKRKTMNNVSTTCSIRSWANLPADILIEILHRTDSRWQSNFRRRFRSVCRSWRCSVSPNPPTCRTTTTQLKFPITVPNLDCKNNKPDFSVTESTYYHISPVGCSEEKEQGWVIRVKEESEAQTWRLLNLNRDNEALFKCTPIIRAEINLLDYKINELTRSYTLVGEHVSKPTSHHLALVFLSPSVIIMGIVLDGRRLCFWKTGETEWSIWSETKEIHQIVSYKGKFYAVDSKNGNVYVIEPSCITKINQVIAAPPQFPKGDQGLYLAVPTNLEGRLYYIVVHRFFSERRCRWSPTPCFADKCSMSMFVLNEEHYRWDSVMSIKDHAFFLFDEASIAVPLRDIGRGSHGQGWICIVNGGGPDCMSTRYQLEGVDNFMYPYYHGFYSDNVCEFNETDPLLPAIIRFLHSPDESSIFFPPPPWIKWRCPARGNNDIVSMVCDKLKPTRKEVRVDGVASRARRPRRDISFPVLNDTRRGASALHLRLRDDEREKLHQSFIHRVSPK